ncbi:DNA topoisomerase 2-binding protein 1-B isoform X4 [Coccinella septempunctata]|uniref:DNA topoisomerase 2-binding protein 1-B isoform X4 n=1 Tax=Coccinella septempunctata TaxID=41139 RepID=UPI001D09575A|nr:DNA topoisomerase 2-binding protein 1-B isoform X4 [Coccinella septempunctata]
MEAVSVIFVLSKELDDESQASEVMLQAFEACKQNKVNTLWVKEQDIPRKELKKTDFIVFENFEGQDFEGIKEAKSASILGPWCILVCLMEGKKIPNFQWPIYNVAMYDCIVTSSHLPKSMKSKIDEMVQRMGGYYNDSLSESTTHLITDSVKSAKYMRAIEMNIKVLTPSWIDAVWEASQEANIHCNDKQFDKFKCPPLHKLIICTTGISSMKEREEVRRLVTENGGEFTAKLNLKKTDFLICDGAAGAMSEKYKQARKTSNVTCVTLQWLHDSIQKGYCVPHEDYVVQKGTSTPQKPDFINPDFSTMSAIDQSKCDRTSVEESVVHNPTYNSASHSSTPTSGAKRKVFAECDNLIEQIDIKKAKKSGQFLDGFSIYLVGFKDDHREKLCKIINASGATRCDDMSDRVTHVIVGDPESHELKIIKSKGFTCFIVTIQWLLDSIDRKRPCGEDPYLVNNLRDESKFKSPMGKKGLSLLRSKRTITEIDLTLSQKEKENLENEMDAEAEKEIMKQYMMPEPTAEEDTLANILKNANFDSERLGGAESDSQNKQHADAPSTEETYTSQTLDQPLDIFRGFSFFITGFDEEQVTEMEEKIQSASGRITNVFRDANYVVAPCFISDPLDYDENITINDLWIYDCITEEQILPIAYYHRPLHVVNPTVLEDCVVTVSGYMGYERNFLSSLIVMLGGVSQEQFCRITSVERNVLGSTHLVIAEAKGKKYAGAVKWRLPAVTQDWLVGCARSEVRLPERDYLVSDAGMNDSDLPSSSVVRVETPKVTSEDSFTIPPPRPVNMGRRDSRSQRSRDPFKTPDRMEDDLPYSQVTPVEKIMNAVRMTNLLGTPESPQVPRCAWDVDTPDTPYGICFDPNPSRSLKKRMLRFINSFPDKATPPAKRRVSTPLSELKRRLWDKIGSNLDSQSQSEDPSTPGRQDSQDDEENESEKVSCTQSELVNTKLKQLEEIMTAVGGSANKSRRQKEADFVLETACDQDMRVSQPCTVQWDFGKDTQEEPSPESKVFMISGVGDPNLRSKIVSSLKELGATVSETSSYDPSATHLLCPKPARNEKTLSCMAAGKWILHIDYVDACLKASKFVNEEYYEFGNPNSIGKISIELDRDIEIRMQAIHYWRNELARTGRGPFQDMRTIIVAEKKQALVSVIEAGGGTVIEATPPFDDTIHATHCLMEPKSVSNFALYEPLARQGIYCVNTLYLSDFLHRTNKDIKDAILPFYQKYFR